MLEEASHNVKPSGGNASAKNDRQDESVNSNSKPNAGQSSGVAQSTQKATANQDLGNNEPFDSNLTSVLNDQPLLQEGANTLNSYQNALLEKLQSLGVDPEKIDALLNLLAIDAADAQEAVAALVSQLGLTQNAVQENFLSDLQKGGESVSALNTQDRLVVDFLRKAGLSDTEAKDFLQKVLRINTDESNINHVNTDKLNSREAPEGNNKPNATDVVRLTHVQLRENKGEAANELIRKQKLKPQQQETAGKTANGRDIASTERIQIQDDLVKALNPLHQSRQNSSAENTIQAALLNSPNLRNAQDKFSPVETSPTKISAEVVSQTDFQAAEKSSGHYNGKQVVKETLLPRGVTENNLMDQIVRKFSIRGAGLKNEIHIRLEPPSLGTVRMNISTTGDAMKTTIIAENHAVRQTIESNLSQLKDSLSQQGVIVENLNVLVGGNPGFPGQNQNQPANRQLNGLPPDRTADREVAEPILSESPPPLSVGASKINVFA
ncbi:MAG: flagellar hook-length control protein FliK [Nitrospinales bacterium]